MLINYNNQLIIRYKFDFYRRPILNFLEKYSSLMKLKLMYDVIRKFIIKPLKY